MKKFSFDVGKCLTAWGQSDNIGVHISGDEEEEPTVQRKARERRCEAPARDVVWSPPSRRLKAAGLVGLPASHRYRGEGMDVPVERAQARNLGGTAK